jgi:hypothetical protein
MEDDWTHRLKVEMISNPSDPPENYHGYGSEHQMTMVEMRYGDSSVGERKKTFQFRSQLHYEFCMFGHVGAAKIDVVPCKLFTRSNADDHSDGVNASDIWNIRERKSARSSSTASSDVKMACYKCNLGMIAVNNGDEAHLRSSASELQLPPQILNTARSTRIFVRIRNSSARKVSVMASVQQPPDSCEEGGGVSGAYEHILARMTAGGSGSGGHHPHLQQRSSPSQKVGHRNMIVGKVKCGSITVTPAFFTLGHNEERDVSIRILAVSDSPFAREDSRGGGVSKFLETLKSYVTFFGADAALRDMCGARASPQQGPSPVCKWCGSTVDDVSSGAVLPSSSPSLACSCATILQSTFMREMKLQLAQSQVRLELNADLVLAGAGAITGGSCKHPCLPSSVAATSSSASQKYDTKQTGEHAFNEPERRVRPQTRACAPPLLPPQQEPSSPSVSDASSVWTEQSSCNTSHHISTPASPSFALSTIETGSVNLSKRLFSNKGGDNSAARDEGRPVVTLRSGGSKSRGRDDKSKQVQFSTKGKGRQNADTKDSAHLHNIMALLKGVDKTTLQNMDKHTLQRIVTLLKKSKAAAAAAAEVSGGSDDVGRRKHRQQHTSQSFISPPRSRSPSHSQASHDITQANWVSPPRLGRQVVGILITSPPLPPPPPPHPQQTRTHTLSSCLNVSIVFVFRVPPHTVKLSDSSYLCQYVSCVVHHLFLF